MREPHQIRKDCGKLPVDKLRLLIESIKRVMIEKTVYQTTIERELKKQREILQKEVEAEKKKSKATTDTGGINDTIIKFLQDHTDIRLFTKNKLEKIGNMSPAEQANFILSIEKNDDTMAKFMQ